MAFLAPPLAHKAKHYMQTPGTNETQPGELESWKMLYKHKTKSQERNNIITIIICAILLTTYIF